MSDALLSCIELQLTFLIFNSKKLDLLKKTWHYSIWKKVQSFSIYSPEEQKFTLCFRRAERLALFSRSWKSDHLSKTWRLTLLSRRADYFVCRRAKDLNLFSIYSKEELKIFLFSTKELKVWPYASEGLPFLSAEDSKAWPLFSRRAEVLILFFQRSEGQGS